jgi:hypothetical protein
MPRSMMPKKMTVTIVSSPFRSGKSGFEVVDDLVQGWFATPWTPYLHGYDSILSSPEINR